MENARPGGNPPGRSAWGAPLCCGSSAMTPHRLLAPPRGASPGAGGAPEILGSPNPSAADGRKAGPPFKGGQHRHAKPAARARRDGTGRAPGFVSSLIRCTTSPLARFLVRGSGHGKALGALLPGPEQVREGPRQACWRARGRGPTRKMPGPGSNAPRAFPWPEPLARTRAKADAVPSDERDDKARRPASPVPSGAGGGLRMAVLASFERAPPFLRSAAEGFGPPRISGAPPAPGDAPRGGARSRCGGISDEPQQSGAPQALRPEGLPLGRASSVLALLPMPPVWDRRAASNPPRPRGQRAESPWGPEPQPCSPGAARATLPYLGIGSKTGDAISCQPCASTESFPVCP